MVSELWNTVDMMENKDVKAMINEIKAKGSEVSLEERIQLYFGLLKVNYIDNALYQLQMISDEITYKGLTSEFVMKHPDVKINLMSGYRVEYDMCGNPNVVPDYSDECEMCCCLGICGCCGGCCSCCCGCGQ